jgi:hypothetical protein
VGRQREKKEEEDKKGREREEVNEGKQQ